MTLSASHIIDLCRGRVNHIVDIDSAKRHANQPLMMTNIDQVNEVQTEQSKEIQQIIQTNEESKSNPAELQENYDYVVTRYYSKLITSDWDLWDAEDIVIWICNLNLTEYQKYGNKLLKTMCKDNINGSYLREMNINDLYRFGIQNENDANYIYHEIQELIKTDTKDSLKGMVMEYMLNNQSLQKPVMRYIKTEELDILQRRLRQLWRRLSQKETNEKQYKETLKVLQIKYDRAYKQCMFKDSVINHYENWLQDMIKNNEIFQNQSDQLKERNIALQGMLNTMRSRYYQLLIDCDWKLWNTQDIVIWMVNLNRSEYESYGQQLLSNMNKEGINGRSLGNLCMNDLQRFGIRDAKHLDHIYQSLQKLISKRARRHSDINNEEKKNLKQHVNVNRNECIICMDRLQDHACIPCGHQCLCQQCKDKIDDKCPVCRKKYNCIIRIYQ